MLTDREQDGLRQGYASANRTEQARRLATREELEEEMRGLPRDDVYRQLAKEQKSDWEALIESVEHRRQERS